MATADPITSRGNFIGSLKFLFGNITLYTYMAIQWITLLLRIRSGYRMS